MITEKPLAEITLDELIIMKPKEFQKVLNIHLSNVLSILSNWFTDLKEGDNQNYREAFQDTDYEIVHPKTAELIYECLNSDNQRELKEGRVPQVLYFDIPIFFINKRTSEDDLSLILSIQLRLCDAQTGIPSRNDTLPVWYDIPVRISIQAKKINLKSTLGYTFSTRRHWILGSLHKSMLRREPFFERGLGMSLARFRRADQKIKFLWDRKLHQG